MLIRTDSLIDFLSEINSNRRVMNSRDVINLHRSELKIWAAMIISSALIGRRTHKKVLVMYKYVTFDPVRIFRTDFQKTIGNLAALIAEGAWLQIRKRDSSEQKSKSKELMLEFASKYNKENEEAIEDLLRIDGFAKDYDECFDNGKRFHCPDFCDFIMDEIKTADRKKIKAIFNVLFVQTTCATEKKTEKMLDLIDRGWNSVEALEKIFGKKNPK